MGWGVQGCGGAGGGEISRVWGVSVGGVGELLIFGEKLEVNVSEVYVGVRVDD